MSLLSAWREGKGQAGFGHDRNLVKRRRFINHRRVASTALDR
jgi:hypothetical protein